MIARLQQLRIQRGCTCDRKLTHNDEIATSGNAPWGNAGLLALLQLPVPGEPSELYLASD
jgi:hypothetical protein